MGFEFISPNNNFDIPCIRNLYCKRVFEKLNYYNYSNDRMYSGYKIMFYKIRQVIQGLGQFNINIKSNNILIKGKIK